MESKEDQIKKAQDRKRYEIEKFKNAKTENMIKFSAYRDAEARVQAGIVAGAVKWEDRDKVSQEEQAKLEKRLRTYLGGVPF